MNTMLSSLSQGLKGQFRVPGDKSISHRAIMLGSLAEGVTQVSGFLEAEDALATLKTFQLMGVDIERLGEGRLRINGVGLHGLKAPQEDLYVGNSGTSMRLLSGILAGQKFDSTLTGDHSLTKRPMRRVLDPLSLMGAAVESTDAGTSPLKVHGGAPLRGIQYKMPMGSAQVKSCLLLAGLYAEGTTEVIEPAITRDHTERMLKGFGYSVKTEGNVVSIEGGGALKGMSIDVPGDISSAAFFLVAASITPNSDITLQHVGVNATRTGIIDILLKMGADIQLLNEKVVGGEKVADIRVKSCQLKGIEVPENLVALAIDEFPVIFVAAAYAEGQTIVTGAEELRVKESDRIQTMADGLQTLGVDAQATADGMIINGGAVQGGEVESFDDHRIAMAFAVAGLQSRGAIKINNCENVATSFPNFVELATQCGFELAAK
ncbi:MULTISPECIES: 3-phosphoshikimate 1-carboxyvinyltransferase [Cycloclasticus]|uniref:3-phosphoshikimate 1-carboxyvinyltransferase n=1 Tax=Cycloclasticus TaxID=34067 RepID=UPI000286A9C5|nr:MULTISPECIES: 3-phosphoshikimate 1-carboxyvinyltransferase [Cycloclasticus]AFT66726.1 3-phosphoshikimate 1-carboxyvinyltransferase [Cycloclasticus sp. P1]MDF1829063.1 3-phosphoshikimate 1-carboxyvinyltransferase [Cycloclasticus pugetii]PHR51952.1 MAG: 3-phosphoshikimate 1-carboxyvinyltransferase [Cycloclasticus sp.]